MFSFTMQDSVVLHTATEWRYDSSKVRIVFLCLFVFFEFTEDLSPYTDECSQRLSQAASSNCCTRL